MVGYPFVEIDFLDRFFIKTSGEQAKGDKEDENICCLFFHKTFHRSFISPARKLSPRLLDHKRALKKAADDGHNETQQTTYIKICNLHANIRQDHDP
jgi:hypothetical protein